MGAVITRSMEVFTLDELSPEARERAVTRMREEAWEDMDIRKAVYGITAEHLTGRSDGELLEKQLQERHGIRVWWDLEGSVAIEGILARATSPALSWPDGIGAVRISVGANQLFMNVTAIWGVDDEEVSGSGYDSAGEAIKAMLDALTDAICKDIEEYAEDITSGDYLVERYEEGEATRRFAANGSEVPVQFWTE